MTTYNTLIKEHNKNKDDIVGINEQLADIVQVNVKDFGAKGDGVTNDIESFKSAINYLSSIGGGQLIIPNTGNKYIISTSNPTILSPTRVVIGANNIHIRGIGNPTIKMNGITQTYIESIDDYLSSGRDVFTVFSFIGVKNCSVKDINFEGEWECTGYHRFASPRAKAIGFMGCEDCVVENVKGFGIMGNLVNAVNSSSVYDGVYKTCNNIKIINSVAIQCYENGFNFMGGTYNCSINNCYATQCGTNGFEGGTIGLTVTGNIFTKNKGSGIAFSGVNTTVTGNVLTENGTDSENGYGNGLQVTYSSDLSTNSGLIQNNIISKNKGFGVMLYPSVKDITIDNNIIKNNCIRNVYQYGIYVTGTSDKKISNISITNNNISDDIGNMVNAVTIGNADFVKVSNNFINMFNDKTYSVIVQSSSTNCNVIENVVNKPVVVNYSALNCTKYNNIGNSKKNN